MANKRSSIFFQRPAFEPQCTHLTMTRVYGTELIYEICHRTGPFGWVFQCTQDREPLIEQALMRGDTTCCDELGRNLTCKMELHHRNQCRPDRFGFLDELSPTTMSGYTPSQIATILRQREYAQAMIQRDKARQAGNAILAQNMTLNALRSPYDSVVQPNYQQSNDCQYQICPRCRPTYSDRSYLSLDSVARGQTLPTAATGFGFRSLGGRPVTDANVVRNVSRGYKVPDIGVHDVLGSFDDQLTATLLAHITSGRFEQASKLRHSPACNNLADYAKCAQQEGSSARSSPSGRLAGSRLLDSGTTPLRTGTDHYCPSKPCFLLEQSVESGAPDIITHA